jgi:lipid-A-disaccharide synthase
MLAPVAVSMALPRDATGKPPPLIYLVAGEASGDALGAGLMRSLRAIRPGIRFAGIGGEAMRQEGLTSLFPYGDLSIMGFSEVLPHIPALLRRLRETTSDVAARQPVAVVTIDSPGFNFRLARSLKANAVTARIKRIHYVAPSVWAYKPGRARKTAALFDALLALLPFEPPYFEKEGLSTTFVGHPVLWETVGGDPGLFRTRHHLGAATPLLLILPGSRAGEVKRHLPVFQEAARALPIYKAVIIASPQVRNQIQQGVSVETLVVDIAEKQDAFAAATIALSKSGTITLELAHAGVPTVVGYKVGVISAWLIRRMALIPFASLINIAADKEVLPELLQEDCTPERIAQELARLARPEMMLEQRRECLEAMRTLRGSAELPPHDAAAAAVLKCACEGGGGLA